MPPRGTRAWCTWCRRSPAGCVPTWTGRTSWLPPFLRRRSRGAPKSTALRAIGDLEPAPRGPYCGAVGWVDAGRRRARLAVGIRSFWAERDVSGRRWLRFGTGAGITWDSDPCGEWEETQLKAARLIGLASGSVVVAATPHLGRPDPRPS
ncbi:chorismate-binding protein [Terrabacter sp. GCM10028922]|uniref:chorismate-binding protein n=1 Tax=Terrabacter sp. GCM10028922 TaxID=3273428 RepID=UPI003618D915